MNIVIGKVGGVSLKAKFILRLAFIKLSRRCLHHLPTAFSL